MRPGIAGFAQEITEAARSDRRRALQRAIHGTPLDRVQYAARRTMEPVLLDVALYGLGTYWEPDFTGRAERIFQRLERLSRRLRSR